MPRVSVIVPNYNHAPYLPLRIESVLGQGFGDFELLILDDCSPDTSRDVIERYRTDPRVRTEFNTRNSGNTFLQWNKGLAQTTGEYVWIAESDDYADPRLLEKLVARLDAHPRAGMAVCNTLQVDAAGNPLRTYFAELALGGSSYDVSIFERDFVMNGREYCGALMVPWNTIPNASGVLFRRTALAAIGGPVTHMRLCGDWYTYCMLLMQFDIARVADVLNFFRQHTQNVRTRTASFDRVREAVAVHRFVARELGRDSATSLAPVIDQYCEMLISDQRAGTENKVPLREIPALLRQSARLGIPMLAKMSTNLLRETAAMAAHRVGVAGRRH